MEHDLVLSGLPGHSKNTAKNPENISVICPRGQETEDGARREENRRQRRTGADGKS